MQHAIFYVGLELVYAVDVQAGSCANYVCTFSKK